LAAFKALVAAVFYSNTSTFLASLALVQVLVSSFLVAFNAASASVKACLAAANASST
jgi:hypothetical protein